jgi:hypothetical protein
MLSVIMYVNVITFLIMLALQMYQYILHYWLKFVTTMVVVGK